MFILGYMYCHVVKTECNIPTLRILNLLTNICIAHHDAFNDGAL